MEEPHNAEGSPHPTGSVSDERFMRQALVQARAALDAGEVPIGAVIVSAEGEVIAAARNERERRQDPTAHAEMLALRAAAGVMGSWRLPGTTMYVTLEPCFMCAGALVLARVRRLVYGPQNPEAGAAYSLYNIPQDPRLNHHVDITPDVLATECADLLKGFFSDLRLPPPEA